MALQIGDRDRSTIVAGDSVVEECDLITGVGEADITDVTGGFVENFTSGIFQTKPIAYATGDRQLGPIFVPVGDDEIVE